MRTWPWIAGLDTAGTAGTATVACMRREPHTDGGLGHATAAVLDVTHDGPAR